MSDWLVLVDTLRDLAQAETPHKVLTVREYLARPTLFQKRRPIVVNLARSYAYQSHGYYASLLAEARGHRIIPTVETILELSRKALYRSALPDLQDQLDRCLEGAGLPPEVPAGADGTVRLLVAFGHLDQPVLQPFARRLFDWFRCPLLEVALKPTTPSGRPVIDRLRPVPVHRLNADGRAALADALHRHTERRWSVPRAKTPMRFSLAVLHNPREHLAPSARSSLVRLANVGARMGIEVEPIQKKDFERLAEFDALFIRETTNIDNHTYRFARRAEQEGMPVIDDTASMIRCTNKVYLTERLTANGLPIPRTIVAGSRGDLARAQDEIGFPMVIKIPDGSFSSGVHKVADRAALEAKAAELFRDSDLLLLQEFMPTEFDWRVGVLDGRPLFCSMYKMVRNHWQVVDHSRTGPPRQGGTKTVAVEDAPAEVIDVGVRAANMIGRGLYGVDLKQTDRGVFVIEINDNPNLDVGYEDAVARDSLWRDLIGWFLRRLEGARD